MGPKIKVRFEPGIFFSAWTQKTSIGTYIPSFIQIGQSIWQRISFEIEILFDFGNFWRILEGTLSLEYHMFPNWTRSLKLGMNMLVGSRNLKISPFLRSAPNTRRQVPRRASEASYLGRQVKKQNLFQYWKNVI